MLEEPEKLSSDYSLLGGMTPLVTPAGGVYPTPLSLDSKSLPHAELPPPSSMEEMQNIFGLSYDAANRYNYQLPGFNPDPFIRQKSYGELDNLLTMGAYSSPLRLVKYATLYKPLEVVPLVNGQQVTTKDSHYDDAQRAADFCRYLIDNIYDAETGEVQDFRHRLWYLLDAIHIGFAVQEKQTRYIEHGPYRGLFALKRLIARRPEAITFNIDRNTNRILSLNNRAPLAWVNNISLGNFLLYTFEPSRELPYGTGVARSCYKHVYAILEGYRIWQVALERFAGGFLDVTTNSTDAKTNERARNLMEGVRQASTIVHGRDLEVDLKMPTAAMGDLFLHFVDHHRTAITKTVLGQELTTGQGSGKGSYALGEVHQGTEKYFLGYPRADLQSLVRNQLFRPFLLENFGPQMEPVIPGFSLGVYDHTEAAEIMSYMQPMIETGIVHPNEPWIRPRLYAPPLDTTLVDDPLLPENIIKKIIEAKKGGTAGESD